MGEVRNELKKKVVQARRDGKSYVWIERNYGVVRGTAYRWVQRESNGTLYIDKRTIEHRPKQEDDYEFLKKCSALLVKIRST